MTRELFYLTIVYPLFTLRLLAIRTEQKPFNQATRPRHPERFASAVRALYPFFFLLQGRPDNVHCQHVDLFDGRDRDLFHTGSPGLRTKHGRGTGG